MGTRSIQASTKNIPEKQDSALTLLINDGYLPGSGAFTATAYHTLPTGARRVCFIVKYTKHLSATTGQWKARIIWRFGSVITDVYEPFVDPTVTTVVEPVCGIKSYRLNIRGPIFDGTTTNGTQVYTFEVPAGADGCIMQLAEVADTTNMGKVTQYISTSEGF